MSETETTETCCESVTKAHTSIKTLSEMLGPFPSLESSENPAKALLHDPNLARKLSTEIRKPLSGAGDDDLCRWFYDTFNSGEPDIQLIVLSHIPLIVGIYLPRAVSRKTVAGFEAVLLALYASETKSRNGNPITITIPDMSQPSLYHEAKSPAKSSGSEPNLAVLSPTLEPHGTVRATRRARIVGIVLELYYSKISLMPTSSKLNFCEFCEIWAGQNGETAKFSGETEELSVAEDSTSNDSQDKNVRMQNGEIGFRIPLPWELLQPILRILGHCLLGQLNSKELKDAAFGAIRKLYLRAVHNMDSQAILATGSLFRLGKRLNNEADETVPPPEPSQEPSGPIKFREPEGLLVTL